MHSKLVSRPGETRMWFVVLERGEKVKEQLLALVKQKGIKNASFVALGALEKATIAYFDWEKKKYQPIPIDTQVEVITLVGDVAPDDGGKPSRCVQIRCPLESESRYSPTALAHRSG